LPWYPRNACADENPISIMTSRVGIVYSLCFEEGRLWHRWVS
jgi:hypothetical protein